VAADSVGCRVPYRRHAREFLYAELLAQQGFAGSKLDDVLYLVAAAEHFAREA